MTLRQPHQLRIIVVVASFLFAGLSGCSYPVQVADRNAPAYSAGIVVKPESWHRSTKRQSQGSVEFAYEHYRGNGEQTLPAGEYVNISTGVAIAGPAVLHNSAVVDHGHIAYRHLLKFGQHFELEPAIGISFDELQLRIEPANPSQPTLDKKEGSVGVLIGVTPRWQFNQYVSVGYQLRASVGDNETWISYSGLEVGVNPFDHVQLKAGYYSREESRSILLNDNIEVSFDGFNAGLTLVF